MKSDTSWEVGCGFMVWRVSNLEDPSSVPGLSISQPGVFTYAAQGDLSALDGMERCCKGPSYKVGGERQQDDVREGWFRMK